MDDHLSQPERPSLPASRPPPADGWDGHSDLAKESMCTGRPARLDGYSVSTPWSVPGPGDLLWNIVTLSLQLSRFRTRFRNSTTTGEHPAAHQQVHADRMVPMKEAGSGLCMIMMTEQEGLRGWTAATSHREGHGSAAE